MITARKLMAASAAIVALALTLAASSPATASPSDATASITKNPGCPPWKSLQPGSGQVMKQCSGEHPINCLKRPRNSWSQIDLCGFPKASMWGDRLYYWGCGLLGDSDCYQRQCLRERNLAAAFWGSAWDFINRIPIPITSAVPQAMILEKISDNTLALIFLGLHKSANWNVRLTCGEASEEAQDEREMAIQESSKPHLSISISKGILFAQSKKVSAATKYADLIGRAITLHAARKDGYSYTKTLSMRVPLGNGKTKTVKTGLGISPTGKISLRITG